MKKFYSTILGLAIVASLNSTAKAQITIDGTFTDWDAVAFTTNTGGGMLTGLKTSADATNIYFYVEATSSYASGTLRVYIDGDNDPSTGLASWQYGNATGSGADFIYEGPITTEASIFSHTGAGGGWGWSATPTPAQVNAIKFSSLVALAGKNAFEFSISRAALGTIGAFVNVGITDDDNASSVPVAGLPNSAYAQVSTALVLPVSFLSFDGKSENNGVKLSWSTASEKNNASFQISKSVDGKNFSKIATIAGSDNSDTQKFYSYTDKNVEAGISYYQLSQTDANGKTTPLKTISVNSDFDGLSLKLTKAGASEVELNINSPKQQNATFTLTDLTGRTVTTTTLNLVKGNQTVKVNANAKGLNIATLSTSQQVISQKYVFD